MFQVTIGNHMIVTTLVCVVAAFLSYTFFSSQIVIGATNSPFAVHMQDDYRDGVHHIEGTVPVPEGSTDVVLSADVRADTLVLFFAPVPRNVLALALRDDIVDMPFSMTVQGDSARYYLAEVFGTIVPVYLE